jgi:hypothetical protein
MSDWQSNLDPDKSKSGGLLATIVFIMLALPFVGIGLAAFGLASYRLLSGKTDDIIALNQPGLILLGLIFVAVGLGIMLAAVWSRRQTKRVNALKDRSKDRPWLVRDDWAAGKIKSSAMAQPVLALIMGVAFCGFGLAAFCFPHELLKGNYSALLLLAFPLAGIGLLIAFILGWRSRLRFGQCFFEPAQIPIPLGGVLEGMIRTGKPLKLEHELNLKIACIRRVQAGKNTSEYVLWQDEKIYTAQANLAESEPGHSGIPIHFKLPDDQPECHSRGDESVFWRLEAKSKMRGPDFHAIFDLPVFKLADATIAADEEDSDPTAALEAPIEEIRRDEHSKIKVTDGPGGREFYFPAARNPGTALLATLLMLMVNGTATAMFHFHAPIFFPIAFGLFGVLLLYGCFNAWFKSSRVTIDSTVVRLTNRWLIFSRTRQFPAGDVSRFATKTGMQSGSQVFTDIKLIPRGSDEKFAASKENSQEPQNVNQLIAARFREAAGPSGVTVAGGIAGVAEANWLVEEMNKALGRR